MARFCLLLSCLLAVAGLLCAQTQVRVTMSTGIYEAEKFNSVLLFRIPKGDKIYVIDEPDSSAWVYAAYYGKSGYVPKEAIESIAERNARVTEPQKNIEKATPTNLVAHAPKTKEDRQVDAFSEMENDENRKVIICRCPAADSYHNNRTCAKFKKTCSACQTQTVTPKAAVYFYNKQPCTVCF